MRLSLILETNLALIANKLSIPQDKLQELLLDADPTNGKYKDYIIKLLLNKNIRLPEDNHRVREALSLFHTHKNRLPVKDINRYKSLHELETTIEQHQGATSKRQGGLEVNPLSLPGVEVLHKQGKHTTLKITNPYSLAELGEGTKWCTRKSYQNCQAWYYIGEYDYIFIMLDGNKPIIQYTPDYEQIMDRNDIQIHDKELLQKLIPKPPLNDLTADTAYNYVCNIIGDRWPEAEEIIARDSYYAYYYASNIIKGRWPQAEPAIATNPLYAHEYARGILKDRFPQAEPAIATESHIAYLYAKDILKDRFPRAEQIIAQNPEYAYRYAKDILQNRFIKAEPTIAKHPHYAFCYAKDILNSRFPQAEPTISQYPEYAYCYAKDIIKAPFPPAEPAIATDPAYAYWYARDVLKGRFPRAEKTIATSQQVWEGEWGRGPTNWADKYNELIKTLGYKDTL